MKIKSLLAAVSMVAITAGSANALQINNPSGIAAQVALACELDFAASPIEAFVGFDIQRGTVAAPAVVPQFNTGINTVVITLPDGITFGPGVAGSSIQAFNTPGSALANSTGGVIAGGLAGDSSVTYSIDLTDNNTTVLRVPQLATSIGTASPTGALTANVTTSTGAVTDGAPAANMDVLTSTGTLMTPGVFTSCVPALTASAVDRDDTGPNLANSDTQIALTPAPTYTTFAEVGTSLQAIGTLGTVELVRATTVPAVAFTNPAGTTALATPQLFNFGTNVGNIDFNVTPSAGTTGIASAVLQDGIGGTTLATGTRSATGFAFSIPYSSALSTGGPDAIVVAPLTGTNAAPIPTQSVAITGSTINLRDTSGVNLLPSVPGANGALDSLQRQGTTCGTYDWNGSTGTNSVYRITGLPAGTTNGSVTFTNDVNGANGVFPFSVTSTNGEGVLTSFDNFNTTNTAWRRADVSLSFEVSTAVGGGIDVDRLLVRNGIITDFGGGANQVIGNNGGSATGTNGTNDDNGGTCTVQ